MGKLRARVSFFAARKDGSESFIGAGQEVEDTHEVILGREDLFESVEPVEGSATPKRTHKAKG